MTIRFLDTCREDHPRRHKGSLSELDTERDCLACILNYHHFRIDVSRWQVLLMLFMVFKVTKKTENKGNFFVIVGKAWCLIIGVSSYTYFHRLLKQSDVTMNKEVTRFVLIGLVVPSYEPDSGAHILIVSSVTALQGTNCTKTLRLRRFFYWELPSLSVICVSQNFRVFR